MSGLGLRAAKRDDSEPEVAHIPGGAPEAPSQPRKKSRGRRPLYTKAAKQGRSSRRKGAEAECSVAAVAREYGFADAERSASMQAGRNRKDEPDVRNVGRLWIESKRYRRTPVNRFAREVLGEERAGFVSVLVYRDDHQPEPYAVVKLSELLKLERAAMRPTLEDVVRAAEHAQEGTP
jgi:hypothetical protein